MSAEDVTAVTEPPEGTASSDHAYDSIRAQILSGELIPGSSFSQVRLAQQLGISRTPLREAVRRLQSEGLLRSEHNRRVRVSRLSTRDFEDLYTLRITLDSLSVRLSVPTLSEQDLTEIGASLELATEAATRGDLTNYRDPHRRFHLGLAVGAGNRLLGEVSDLWDHADRYRLLYQAYASDSAQVMQLASQEHRAIFEAAERRDGVACARLVAAHLARTALITMSRVDPHHDPSAIRAALDLVSATGPTSEAAADAGRDVPVLGYERDDQPRMRGK